MTDIMSFSAVFIDTDSIRNNRFTKLFIYRVALFAFPVSEVIGKIFICINNIVIPVNNGNIVRNLLK